MAAVEAGDFTALIEGCGNQLVPGYTYCRKQEGTATADQKITLVAPATEKKKVAATYKIFFPDGSPSLGGSFNPNSTRVDISWKDLTRRATFEVNDRGFWGVLIEVNYVDNEGNSQRILVEGEIRMRVLKANYVPLNDVQDDPSYSWKWKHNSLNVAMTTAGRTYVSKR